MRLNDYDRGIQVEDQRGMRGRMAGPGGKIGCGSLIIAIIAALVFGVDPAQMLGQLEQGQVQTDPVGSGGKTLEESCSIDQASREACNTLSSLDQTWAALFAEAGERYARPKLVFYSQAGQSGCGAAQSAMGPFYCPADQGIYLDTDFFREMEQRLGASGDFARMYVVAHEMGHHIQTITGTADQVRAAQARAGQAEANAYQVRMELQADCYAGVWAAKNASRVEPGDVEEGMKAAHSIGDDTLMRSAGRRPVEEAFTHGSSEQRMRWLRVGMQTGDPNRCNTFSTNQL